MPDPAIQFSLLDAAVPLAEGGARAECGDGEEFSREKDGEAFSPEEDTRDAREARRRTSGMTLVPAAYGPDSGRPLCPRCWSSPQVKRYTRGIRGAPRGWGAASAGESEMVGGARVAVIETIYRCANNACETAIALRMLVTGGYVPRLVESRRLSGVEASRFRAGVLRRDGVWVAADGRPRTAGEQFEFGLA